MLTAVQRNMHVRRGDSCVMIERKLAIRMYVDSYCSVFLYASMVGALELDFLFGFPHMGQESVVKAHFEQ